MTDLRLTDLEFTILRAALRDWTKNNIQTADMGLKDALRGLILKIDNEARVKRGEAPRSLHDIAKGVK